MAIRVYIVPVVTANTGPGGAPCRAPDYVPALGVPWSAMYYGLEPVALVRADVDAAQHSTLAASAPITVVPANLDASVGAAVTTVEAALESWSIPGQWVASGLTYRQVLRGVATIFQFAQRFDGLHRLRIFGGTVTLDTTVAQLPQAARDKLAAVSDSFGWDRSGVTGATTLRQLLRGAAQQWNGGVLLGGEVL